jgi:hypothetical protein
MMTSRFSFLRSFVRLCVFVFILEHILMMMMIRSIIFLVIFTISFSAIFADDPCRFVHPKGVIDLTSLGRTDGKPAYPDQVPTAIPFYSMFILFQILKFTIQCLIIIEYSYNPCKPFSEGDICQNVSVCQGE